MDVSKEVTAIAPDAVPSVIYSVTDDKLAALVAASEKLTTAEGKKNYAAVKKAIRPLVSARTDIEKERKAKKAGILEAGRKIDGEAKRLTGIITEEEQRLVALKNEVDEVEERRKAEERAALKARIAAISDADEKTALSLNPDDYHPYENDAAYAIQMRLLQIEREAEVEKERQRAEAERKALEAERAEMEKELQAEAKRRAAEDAERAKLQAIEDEKRAKAEAKEKAERDRIAAEQKAEADKLAAERAKIEAERRDIEQQKERERMEREAAERAEREHAEKLAREKAEAERAEALRPDREKLAALADHLNMCLDECYPEIDDMQLLNQLVLGCDHIKRGIKILRESK